MAYYKSFTSVEQSRKLAKFLPLESVDAFYVLGKEPVDIAVIYGFVTHKHLEEQIAYRRAVPCWSLAALLSVLPNGIVMNKDSQNGRYHFSSTHAGTYITTDNPVDACAAMIEKLNELNLL